MKTYLNIWFNSEGGKPSEVASALISLGFKPMQGQHDFVMEWGRNASVDEILHIGDTVQYALRGRGILFKLETA